MKLNLLEAIDRISVNLELDVEKELSEDLGLFRLDFLKKTIHRVSWELYLNGGAQMNGDADANKENLETYQALIDIGHILDLLQRSLLQRELQRIVENPDSCDFRY